MGYLKDMFRQDVPVRKINTSGKLLQYWMKIWQPEEDTNPGNTDLSTDEDANQKIAGILCKLLQQQEAPELDIYFDGNRLDYHLFMALFCEVVETKIEDSPIGLTSLIK